MKKSMRWTLAVALFAGGIAIAVADAELLGAVFWFGLLLIIASLLWLAMEYATMKDENEKANPLFSIRKAKRIVYENHRISEGRRHSDIDEVDDLDARNIKEIPADRKT
ncbi:hypothetical protein [Jiella avicenniae]|uniref:Uncharacterized protein n=1 Tax=Jiella avicenniae TaxID=2907202 RepID=A0A9X1P2G6_9HYPH|nr:hypothetical protein [Jiella avicenniae]MCE7029120.1 hypothetical protein [Jiella avicenniae]